MISYDYLFLFLLILSMSSRTQTKCTSTPQTHEHLAGARLNHENNTPTRHQTMHSLKEMLLTNENNSTNTKYIHATERSILISSIIGGSIGMICVFGIVICIIMYIIFRYPKRRIQVKLESDSLELQALVLSDIACLNNLTKDNKKIMNDTLHVHNVLIRKNVRIFRGNELYEDEGTFLIAFKNPYNAIDFCNAIHQELLNVSWPPCLQKEGLCRTVVEERTGEVLFNGLRVRMGIHLGYVETGEESKNGSYNCKCNTFIWLLSRVTDEAEGGLTYMTGDVYGYILRDKSISARHIIDTSYIRRKGVFTIDEMKTEMYLVLPNALASRDGLTMSPNKVESTIPKESSLSDTFDNLTILPRSVTSTKTEQTDDIV